MKALKGTMLGAGTLLALALAACSGQQAAQLTASGLDAAKFDTVVNGDTVKLYTLSNAAGMEVCITNYGGRVVSIMVPDRDGKLQDVVLGFDNIAQYLERNTDYGSSVGRYANRINLGRFVLNGDTIQLKQNDLHPGDRNHCLHGGGDTGWMNRVYRAEQKDSATPGADHQRRGRRERIPRQRGGYDHLQNRGRKHARHYLAGHDRQAHHHQPDEPQLL